MSPRAKQLNFRYRMLVTAAAFRLMVVAAWAEPEIAGKDASPWSQWLAGATMTGDWGGLRATLLDRGIEFFGGYDAEGWGNATGGLERGAVYTGLLFFGLHLDLEKAVGWPAASLGTKWLWLSGEDASAHLVGNFLTISSIAGFNTLRDSELWFQQTWLNDAISLGEAQFRWNQRADETGLPGQFNGGVWFHTARFVRFADEGAVHGNYGIYFILDQMLYSETGTYQAQVTKWLNVQPDLQYIINPGGKQDLGNALVLGCRVALNF